MKPLKLFLLPILICLVELSGFGATIQWYSDQPATTTLHDTDIIAVEVTGPQGYKSVTFLSIKNWLGTNGASTQIITNLITQNLYSSNAYFTNVTVVNEFHGKTVFNETSYTTNLFVTTINTNFVLYSTNIYNADTYVSNYFNTNVFLDTYVSNFFQTNQIFYSTNLYLTEVSTTNFLEYITNSYISNFWNTNIYVNDTYVSNYFTTNYYPLIEITSNYTFNVAWPLTNATLWGTTTFAPTNGTTGGSISMYSNNVEMITLNAAGGSVSASTVWFSTNLWAGPTNTLPMNLEDQFYLTSTDCSITNIGSLPTTGKSAGVILTISNSTAANVLIRFPSTLAFPERTNSMVLSNASQGMLSIRWHPRAGTNGIWRQW